MHAKSLLRLLRGTGLELPVLVVVAEGGWAAVTADWGADDVILHTAGPGEVEARLRLAIGRRSAAGPAEAGEIRSGDLVIDEASYSVRLRGRVLDLTFKEYEVLIGTVRNVGYRFVPAPGKAEGRRKPSGTADQSADGDEQRATGAGRPAFTAAARRPGTAGRAPPTASEGRLVP